MNATPHNPLPRPVKVARRETLVAMLRAALEGGEVRFARQAALNWLAAYPGDLEIHLLQAQVTLAEGRTAQAMQALDLLIRKDPLGQEGYRLMAKACQGVDLARCASALTSQYAISGLVTPGTRLEPWGEPLRLAVEALESKQYEEAEKQVREAAQLNPDLLLAAVVHLLLTRATRDASTVADMARRCHSRWPETLIFRLVLAETQLELGDEPEAVRLLHLCVAKDSTGITARRLWGSSHPYRSLWPEEMVIHFDLPIPAGVAWRMGWNSLGPGETYTATGEGTEQPVETVQPFTGPEKIETAAPVPPVETGPVYADPVPAPADADEETTQPAADGAEEAPAAPPPSANEDQTQPAEMERALETLAKKVKQPQLGRADGRFPVYVIFSSKEGLVHQYGPRTAEVLDGELRRLAAAVRQRKNWGALVYYPDDAACASQCGLLPMAGSDAWKLKNALGELDAALGKRGERIGALLIIGGDSVVPFHRLPNPTDDADGDVASDNPYATLDSNYFIPEWPVGRLPGENGPDAGFLLEQIRQAVRYHNKRTKRGAIFGFDFGLMFRRLFEPLLPKRPALSFGYTAAVWRRSSLAVFRPIGAPHTVLASPPEHSGSIDRERIINANLCYYNLHGVEDGPAWYGQRDPMEPAGTDYPVALAPEDLHRNGHAPRIVFSEACYGGHVIGKGEKTSLALKFLSLGTLGVVASTCIAYGSVNTPLVAADLLGSRFWQHLKSGRPAGESLLQAKIDLAREMERRQGFLDGEDQKTLISFVLYGDPLADYDGFRQRGKAAPRLKDHLAVKTVCDRTEAGETPPTVPPEVLKQVKGLLAEYLPGADLAELHFARQHTGCNGHHQPAVTSSSRAKHNGSGRLVVTATKQVEVAHRVHRHYVRMTLDEGGKPVKVSISR